MKTEHIKSFFQWVLIFSFSSLLFGCGTGETDEVENGSDVVAIVNKENITR